MVEIIDFTIHQSVKIQISTFDRKGWIKWIFEMTQFPENYELLEELRTENFSFHLSRAVYKQYRRVVYNYV